LYESETCQQVIFWESRKLDIPARRIVVFSRFWIDFAQKKPPSGEVEGFVFPGKGETIRWTEEE